MSYHIQSFHPQMIIVDHFDEIINQIDIKTETLLERHILTDETRNKLNKIREKQIEIINELKEMNLVGLTSGIFNEFAYRQKWSHVIDDISLDYKEKLDKIKEESIIFDCVLLENSNLINGLEIWITSWYHNEKNLEFLK
jgi:hypothetical protein